MHVWIVFIYYIIIISLCSFGDIYDPLKNPPGTEIKAITYSNMQIHETQDRSDVYVIVDIWLFLISDIMIMTNKRHHISLRLNRYEPGRV